MLHDIPVFYRRRNILTRYKYNFNERTEISRLSLYIFLTICRLKRIPSTATYIVDDDECIDRLQSASLENASILASRDRQRDINHINRRIDRTTSNTAFSGRKFWNCHARPTNIYVPENSVIQEGQGVGDKEQESRNTTKEGTAAAAHASRSFGISLQKMFNARAKNLRDGEIPGRLRFGLGRQYERFEAS